MARLWVIPIFQFRGWIRKVDIAQKSFSPTVRLLSVSFPDTRKKCLPTPPRTTRSSRASAAPATFDSRLPWRVQDDGPSRSREKRHCAGRRRRRALAFHVAEPRGRDLGGSRTAGGRVGAAGEDGGAGGRPSPRSLPRCPHR